MPTAPYMNVILDLIKEMQQIGTFSTKGLFWHANAIVVLTRKQKDANIAKILAK